MYAGPAVLPLLLLTALSLCASGVSRFESTRWLNLGHMTTRMLKIARMGASVLTAAVPKCARARIVTHSHTCPTHELQMVVYF